MYPKYLQDDINRLTQLNDSDSLDYSLYYCELYGSINSAWADGEITFEEAANLRRKYLNI